MISSTSFGITVIRRRGFSFRRQSHSSDLYHISDNTQHFRSCFLSFIGIILNAPLAISINILIYFSFFPSSVTNTPTYRKLSTCSSSSFSTLIFRDLSMGCLRIFMTFVLLALTFLRLSFISLLMMRCSYCAVSATMTLLSA